MKVFVTGATGFVGSHIVERILEDPEMDVYVLRRKTSNLRWLEGKRVNFVLGEVRDPESLEKAIEGMDVVIHAAGVVKAKDWNTFYENNVKGTENVINAILKKNPNLKRFIHISSQAVSHPSSTPITEEEESNPVSLYGKSKYIAEQKVKEVSQKIPTTIIRPASVLGPRDKEFLPLFKIIKSGIYPIVGGNKRKISLVYVKDLAEAVYLALKSEISIGKTYFVCNPEIYTWGDLLSSIRKAMNKRFVIPIYVPMFILDTLGIINTGISRLFNIHLMLTYQKVKEIKQDWVCSPKKIMEELGFKPKYNLSEAVKETYEWYKMEKWL